MGSDHCHVEFPLAAGAIHDAVTAVTASGCNEVNLDGRLNVRSATGTPGWSGVSGALSVRTVQWPHDVVVGLRLNVEKG
jgi:hypothetical protein